MTSGNQLPPEDTSMDEQLSDAERFRISREKPYGIETKRGIIKYHNELVDYGQEIDLKPGEEELTAIKKTIFYGLVNSYIAADPKGRIRLLDLGCGNGQFLRELKLLFGDKIETYGVTARAYDREGQPIMEEAKEQDYLAEEKKNGVNIEVHNMSDLGRFSDGFFDLVVSAEGINYAGDPLKVIEQSARVLRKGGLMLAGPVAVKFEGMQSMVAGNFIFHPKLQFQGLSLKNDVQNTSLKDDVICFEKDGKFFNPFLRFSHSIKAKNGAVYKIQP